MRWFQFYLSYFAIDNGIAECSRFNIYVVLLRKGVLSLSPLEGGNKNCIGSSYLNRGATPRQQQQVMTNAIVCDYYKNE